jgi:hypothetical protein
MSTAWSPAMAMVLALSTTAAAQSSGAQPATADRQEAAAAPAADDDDTSLDTAQPDFSVVALPTTLRLPKHKSAFRLTHRFNRPLAAGSFGDLASDLFGFDSGAQIGLEYRFGIMRGTQAGIYRTSDRTIQFFGEREIVGQAEGRPIAIAAYAAVEGTDNFRDIYSPALGAVVSHAFAGRAAVYAQPLFVGNTNPLPSDLVDHNNTFMIGLGARVNIAGHMYGVFEYVPRVSGYDPGNDQVSFGVEGQVGGHIFQLNFSNGLGTTMAQVARGGPATDDWFIGFNLSRKFW